MKADDWMPLRRIDYRTFAGRERFEQRLPEIEGRAIEAERLHEAAKARKEQDKGELRFGRAA